MAPKKTAKKVGGTAKPKKEEEAPKETAEEARMRLLHEKYDSIFGALDKGAKGGLKKGELAQVIRDRNDEYAFLQDSEFGPFVKQAWADAQPDEEGLVRLDQFVAWYDTLIAHLDSIKQKEEQAEAAKKEEAAAAKASMFSGDGMWDVPLQKLQDALLAAWEKKKTPLLIDTTFDEPGSTSALETFYSYSGHQLLELKKMVVEVNMKKTVTLDQAMEEARSKLILSMKRGYNLVLLLANSAPPLKSKFSSPTHLPYMLVEDQTTLQSVLGVESNWREIDWTKTLIDPVKDEIQYVHKDFNVVVVTKFGLDDYKEFLKEEIPLDSMQHIKVYKTS